MEGRPIGDPDVTIGRFRWLPVSDSQFQENLTSKFWRSPRSLWNLSVCSVELYWNSRITVSGWVFNWISINVLLRALTSVSGDRQTIQNTLREGFESTIRSFSSHLFFVYSSFTLVLQVLLSAAHSPPHAQTCEGRCKNWSQKKER